MHFFIRETLSFNLIYVAACYLMGTGMCHNMVGLLQHYIQIFSRTRRPMAFEMLHQHFFEKMTLS